VQIGKEVAEIHLFVYLQDGGRPPSSICYFGVLEKREVPLTGCVVRANGVIIRYDVTETLPFYVFGDLAGKNSQSF